MLFPIYNAVMLAIDVAILAFLARWPSARGLFVAILTGVAAVVLVSGGAFSLVAIASDLRSPFALFGLLTWGVFLHGTLLLIGAGVIVRRRFRRFAITCFGLAALQIVVIVDATLIEPQWIEVSHHEIATAKVTAPVRIVVIADVQTDDAGPYERRALRLAMEQEPDLVLFAGDYAHITGLDRYEEQIHTLRTIFEEEGLSAPLGVVAVRGNCDRPCWTEAFTGLGVETLEETRSLAVGELVVTGLGFRDSENRHLVVPDPGGFHVVLGHSPNFALGEVSGDLLLAGHTHGGQVQIPGFGPPLTLSLVSRHWASGRTELEGGRTLIVSRGIGMERIHAPRIRFFCRPEIVVVDLVPSD